MDLRLSIAFHPETDDQSKVTIHMLENFLWPYIEVHPHTGSKYLSLAEFAANNLVNASTSYSPFVLNAGEPPTPPKSLDCFSRQRNKSNNSRCSECDEEGTGDSTTQLHLGTIENQATGG